MNVTSQKKKGFGLQTFLSLDGNLNSVGVGFLCLAAVIISLIIWQLGLIGGVLVLALSLGIPIVVASLIYPKFGILTFFILASVIFFIIRMASTDFPLGILLDIYQALLIIGFFIKQKQSPNWEIFKNPVTVVILVWVAYNIVQVGNPNAESRLAWVYTIRSVAVSFLMHFVFLYNLDSKKFIRLMLKAWLTMAMIAALYALKQETIGYFAFEEKELADPVIRSLLFIAGHWRKFSIYSDPVAYGFNMALSAILCFVLILGPQISRPKKWVLGFMMMFFLITMLFSGTRGAYVLFPVAMGLLAVMTFTRKVLIFGLTAAAIFATVIFLPTQNGYIYRFQTAFRPAEDNSFNVRTDNMAKIRPYIQSHPIGGGLGATGVWGKRFSPYSFLADFPADSGFQRVAVETGWLGLLLICTVFFVCLRSGVQSYFRIQDPELKNYCLAMVLIVFALNIANYPQEALINFPTPFFFHFAVAMFNALFILDKKQRNEQKTKLEAEKLSLAV
jgi:putative inorganic carbon (HCO3(-)) transporter